jgi:GGDEF domain-containing protein
MSTPPRAPRFEPTHVAALLAAAREVVAPDPFAGAAARAVAEFGAEGGADFESLLGSWASRAPGNPTSEMRYRWETSHRRGVRVPSFSPVVARWRAWRSPEQPSLEKDPFAFEERLSLPVAICNNVELLAGQAARSPLARQLLAEVMPIARRDLALSVQGLRPWTDTFALWCVARAPLALGHLHAIAVAVAAAYSAAVVDDAVLDLRFPFHEKPVVSATAHLASALLALGTDLELCARLCATVSRRRAPDGTWADGHGAPDVLTTLAGADLVSRVDPDFDVGPTRAWLLEQAHDGLWWALGPDAPWLTAVVLDWFDRAAKPFGERFMWPFLADQNRDRKTGLPFFSYFAGLAELFAALPGLARARTEIAFFDLIGFRDFNNQHGQQRGDEVLACFARFLAEIPAARAIRDGGDEFLLVGAPLRVGLFAELEQRRSEWVARYRDAFGDGCPLVVPRVLVAATRGSSLVATRERLGREVATLKHSKAGADGLLVDAGLVPRVD